MRDEANFFAVWREGMEWPHLFVGVENARARAHQLAKELPGREVHVMHLKSGGTVRYDDKPAEATGLAA